MSIVPLNYVQMNSYAGASVDNWGAQNNIDSLWGKFRTGGLMNPLDVIEQITYFMFIYDLNDFDNKHAKKSAMLGIPHASIFEGMWDGGGICRQIRWAGVPRYH